MNELKSNSTILVTGASGLVGQALCKKLLRSGHRLLVTGRKPEAAFRANFSLPCEYLLWADPTSTPPPARALEADAIVHLLGEPIAETRWSDAFKKKLADSRILSTRQLVTALKANPNRVQTFVTASAVGIYGERGDESLNESSAPGSDFLAKLCIDWEKEAQAAPCRSVQMRIGVVLSEFGGALKKITPLFEKGIGGKLGNGKQWMSWIHLDDLVDAIFHALHQQGLRGPVNAVAPNPITNATFTTALARALHAPAFLPAPKAALKLALGERAVIVLASQKISPRVLLDSQFKFRFGTIESALQAIYGWKTSRHDRLFTAELWLSYPRSQVFQFFCDEKNLEKITPDFLNFEVTGKSTPTLGNGTEISYRLKIHGVPAKWVSRLSGWIDNEKFVDEQMHGPYGKWHHTHLFEDLQTGTLMTDRVIYRMPMTALGGNIASPWVKSDILKIFNYRTKIIGEVFPTKT
jgi:uncharacterized protein (TIGR01777 family)